MLLGSGVKLEPPQLSRYEKYSDYLKDFEQYVRTSQRVLSLVSRCNHNSIDNPHDLSGRHDAATRPEEPASKDTRVPRPRRRGKKRSGTRRHVHHSVLNGRDNDALPNADNCKEDHLLDLLKHEARQSGVKLSDRRNSTPPPFQGREGPKGDVLHPRTVGESGRQGFKPIAKVLPDVQSGPIPSIPVVREYLSDTLDDAGILRMILSGRTPRSYVSLSNFRSHVLRVRSSYGLGLRSAG